MKITIVISILFATTLMSQKDTIEAQTTGMIRFQVLNVDFSNFNARIGDDYPMMNNEVVGIGAELGSHAGRVSAKATGTIYQGSQKNTVTFRKTTLSGYGGGIVLGYDLVQLKSFRIQSFFECGFRKYNLILQESTNYSLQDILNQDIQNLKFENPGMYMDVILGLTKYFNISKYSFGFNLSAGFRADFGEWKYEGINKLSDEISDMGGVFGMFKFIIIPVNP